VIQRRTGGRIDAHADQPAKQKVAREARGPCARNFLVRGMICGSYPSLLTVTVMSALRLATTTHGVTQVVGTLSPETSAVAPDGVLEMEMFSVVPRVTRRATNTRRRECGSQQQPDHWIIPLRPPRPSRNLRLKASHWFRPPAHIASRKRSPY